LKNRHAVVQVIPLARQNRIGSVGQHRAGHHFDRRTFSVRKGDLWLARSRHALNQKPAATV
jgi:hypothetical protein